MNSISQPVEKQSARIIQRFWREKSSIKELETVKTHLTTHLTLDERQKLSNLLYSIGKKCSGDGSGLLGGSLSEMIISEFFEDKIPDYKKNNKGESDMNICDISFSFKKINGKSTIALDWSKNETTGSRERFVCPIMILNMERGQWWKKNPLKIESKIKITYNDTIPAGIYLIDKRFCKNYVKITKNNKTNTLIESQYLYLMLKRSIMLNTYIELPPSNKEYDFNILKAFFDSE
jgi:hypothetical protein